MKQQETSRVIRAGDFRGLGRIYASGGELLLLNAESILKTVTGWDVDVMSPWRQVLPHVVFEGYGGKAESRLYITTKRIVLIRDIDLWREVKGELTPLGLPAAAEKENKLRRLAAAGAKQFCEIWPQNLRVVRAKVVDRRRSWMDLQLMGVDGKQYAITIWKTNGRDPETLALLDSRFPRGEFEPSHTAAKPDE